MKDAVATMGAILLDDASGRDAVHVAVFSAISAVKLFPSQDVGAISDGEGRDVAVAPLGVPHIGIVDPFLRAAVPAGERFWVYLYPRTITGLAHRWSHPAFEETATVYAPPSDKLVAELWLTKWCAGYDNREYGFSMMETLQRIFDGTYDDDEYLTVYGSDEKGPIPGDIWKHASVVFGKPVPTRKPSYFSCSC